MTELEKLQRAKMYIYKLANGINPIDDAPVKDSDIINNVRLSRCLFYVSDVLGQIIDNNGVVSKTKSPKKAFFISSKEIAKFPVSATPITLNEIAKRLNSLVDLDVCCKLKLTSLSSWLMEIGALELRITADGRNIKIPTVQGNELGIFSEKRMGMNGEYRVVVYSREAQQFILDNIEAIVCHANVTKKNTVASENQGQVWSPAHVECLIDLFSKNVPVSEIAVTLKRSEGGVRAKLKKLGLIDNRSDASKRRLIWH